MAERYENDELPDAAAQEVETPAPAGRSAKPWLKLIDDAERAFELYQAKADNVDKLYADLEKLANVARDREFQLFWANVSVLGPSIYSRPPTPVVVPRFKDRRAVPRVASELLERSTIVGFELEDIDQVMRLIRDDLTVNARGVAWVRYEAKGTTKDYSERFCIEHRDRKDFVHDPARKWKEVDWAASRGWLTRAEMRQRFRRSSGNAYQSAKYTRKKDDDDDNEGAFKAGVWELWSRSQNKVVWVAEGCDVTLDEGEPHLQLEGFFPCPRPAYATVQRRSLIPVPDFLFYKDQLEEINELTARIGALCQALQVRGFYPSGAGDISDAIETAIKSRTDNQLLVPIANWAMVGNGGVKDMIVWLPIEQVAVVLKEVIALRKELFEDVYQITGLSDIMRGQTEASETLGAQQLKSEYGSVRIRDRRDEMVRMARDLTRIAAEIMAENFRPKTLLDMSQLEIETDAQVAAKIKPLQAQLLGLQRELQTAQSDPEIQQMAAAKPDEAKQIIGQIQSQAQGLQAQIDKLSQTPTIEKVMGLLREQRLRPFVLDIETDSTIAPDENAQKQRATEFTTAVGGLMKEALPLVQTVPQAAGLFAETLKFMASQFRAGRQLEAVIDDFADQMAQLGSQPKPPSPEAIKAEADAETAKADAAEKTANAQKTAAEAQAKGMQAQTEAADAESARRIAEQREIDAADARRVDRDGKIAVTNKQIELMQEKHAQDMAKGTLEIAMLKTNIAKSRAEAIAAGADAMSEDLADGGKSPLEPLQDLITGLSMKTDRLAEIVAAPNIIVRDGTNRVVGSRKQL